MPLLISRLPFPSGEGSPETTIRKSLAIIFLVSLPQLTPTKCLSSSLAPQIKSDKAAAAKSTITGISRLTTPIEPKEQPNCFLTTPSSAI